MPTAMTGWKANDGRWFDDQLSATRHEVLAEMRKSFPEIADRMVQVEKIADRLAICLSPLALVAQEPPLSLGQTTLETTPATLLRTWRDNTAPMDNLPEGWSYRQSYTDDEDRLTDTYEKDGAQVDWRRSEEWWPGVMTGQRGQFVERFGKTAPLGCAHEWEIDTPVELTDTCKHCGEGRA